MKSDDVKDSPSSVSSEHQARNLTERNDGIHFCKRFLKSILLCTYVCTKLPWMKGWEMCWWSLVDVRNVDLMAFGGLPWRRSSKKLGSSRLNSPVINSDEPIQFYKVFKPLWCTFHDSRTSKISSGSQTDLVPYVFDPILRFPM